MIIKNMEGLVKPSSLAISLRCLLELLSIEIGLSSFKIVPCSNVAIRRVTIILELLISCRGLATISKGVSCHVKRPFLVAK